MVSEKNVSVRMCYKKVSVDERTQDYIAKRMEKIDRFSKKFSELNYETEIYMDKKGKFGVDLMLKTPYKLYRVEEMSESIEGSIDLAVDNLKNQLVKDKDRLKELRERGARSIKKMVVVDESARFKK